MTAFATAEDLAAIWRPLSEAEATQANLWLDLASIRIRQRFTDIDQRIADGTLNPALAGHVAVMMALRAMTRRLGDQPIQERIGEAAQTYAEPSSDSPYLFITDDEAALLAPVRTTQRPWTIALGVGTPLP